MLFMFSKVFSLLFFLEVFSANFYSTPPDLIDVQEDSGLTPLSIQLPSHSGPFYLDQAPARGPSSLPYTSYFYYILYTVYAKR